MKENNIEKLVGENLNFVKSVANKYVGKGVEFDDLVSEGCRLPRSLKPIAAPNS